MPIRVCILFALISLSPAFAGPSPGDGDVAVDRNLKRAEVTVTTPEGRLIISLDPLMNLTIHTMNVYDLLGLHGRDYTLRGDPAVKRAMEDGIYAAIAGKEQYFNANPQRVNLYAPTIQKVLAESLYLKYPEPELLNRVSPDPLNKALAAMWTGFYRAYWDARFPALADEFRQMSENMHWPRTLARMEKLTGKTWTGTMHVFAVEGTAHSAMTWGKNVAIGTVRPKGDAGFVHEGLHLLLRNEAWAQSPRIAAFMASREFNDGFWHKKWASKYEQALVVCLDAHISGKTESAFVQQYMKGCGVGDLYEIAWPLVTAHVEKGGGDVEDLMWHLVTSAESR